MPHRVVNFIRSSTENISSINPRVARARTSRDLERSYSNSISDESECNSLKMADTGELHGQKKHHRLSFTFGRSSKGAHDPTGASLDWKIESPPIIFYGDAENSTGALVSGQLFLTVREEVLEVESFEASLNIRITQKRPFHTHCPECSNQYTELKRWTFLSHPTTLNRGMRPDLGCHGSGQG
jgi:arrestin-related trafficking adapter 1